MKPLEPINKINVLITGSSGFIGFHLSRRFLEDGFKVLGIDGLTDYYDVELKKKRNAILNQYSNFHFEKFMLEDANKLENIITNFRPNFVFHLAAQAGVRYSIDHPKSYLDSNIVGTFNLLETLKSRKCSHLLLASTSSVYGSNVNLPYEENNKADNPLSFYAATKKATEVMAHSYSHIYRLPTTCFRFFTVYGPWGRPDMALFKFTEAILNGEAINVFNNGEMWRDFTYIDDLVEAICRLRLSIPENHKSDYSSDSKSNSAPWRVVNIGNANPVKLLDFISVVENELGIVAKKKYLPMQVGDVEKTSANTDLLFSLTNYIPTTDIKIGIKNFVNWYIDHYNTGE